MLTNFSTAPAALESCWEKASRKRYRNKNSSPQLPRSAAGNLLLFRREKSREPISPGIPQRPAEAVSEKPGEKIREKFRRKLPQAKKEQKKRTKESQQRAAFAMTGTFDLDRKGKILLFLHVHPPKL